MVGSSNVLLLHGSLHYYLPRRLGIWPLSPPGCRNEFILFCFICELVHMTEVVSVTKKEGEMLVHIQGCYSVMNLILCQLFCTLVRLSWSKPTIQRFPVSYFSIMTIGLVPIEKDPYLNPCLTLSDTTYSTNLISTDYYTYRFPWWKGYLGR
jgi:hypothetical protein